MTAVVYGFISDSWLFVTLSLLTSFKEIKTYIKNRAAIGIVNI